ncbi:MAG: MATE family efflux transporter [Ruminococcus flavefaciens]|nr:MATE family efflux transporter [Ruminococcus flavefaciens]MCM1230953.1 MATE family efflux transporter [Ruminococcus flavefaciens]
MKDDFKNKLFKLVIPITLQNFMLALVSVSDTVMMGFLNQSSLSAVSLAGQVQFVLTLFVFAVTGGVSIMAAQYWGIKDKDTVEKVLAIGFKFIAPISVLFTIVAFIFPELLMKCFASDEELVAIGTEYLRVVAPSYFFIGISQLYLCIMKNCGQAGTGSLISSLGVILNIILNWLFIFGVGPFPRMEVKGAALATAISTAFELFGTIVVMLKKDSIKIRLKYVIHSDKAFTKDYMKYSLPLLGNQLAWGLGFTMYSVILGHLGSDAAAANSIANIIKNLSICVCQGVASASAVIIGEELGKGMLDTAKQYGSKLCRISLICGIASGLVVLCIIPFVPLFDTISSTAQHYLRIMLAVCSYYVVGKAMNMTIIGGIFPAGGDSRFGFKCDTITMWCVTVPIGLIFAFLLKMPVLAVYIAINIDEIVKLPAVYKHYVKYNWLNNLTQKQP